MSNFTKQNSNIKYRTLIVVTRKFNIAFQTTIIWTHIQTSFRIFNLQNTWHVQLRHSLLKSAFLENTSNKPIQEPTQCLHHLQHENRKHKKKTSSNIQLMKTTSRKGNHEAIIWISCNVLYRMAPSKAQQAVKRSSLKSLVSQYHIRANKDKQITFWLRNVKWNPKEHLLIIFSILKFEPTYQVSKWSRKCDSWKQAIFFDFKICILNAKLDLQNEKFKIWNPTFKIWSFRILKFHVHFIVEFWKGPKNFPFWSRIDLEDRRSKLILES